ncbi:hypothetical protein BASA81_010186 [Batrachochytrium salamandrivorans]|nr:hypothetical protein BASA81_010186 [Batrachochytrium salamandrivorans]
MQPTSEPTCFLHSPLQYQQRFVDNSNRHPANQPFTSITATPVQQRPTSNDMDNRLCTSWSSHFFRKTAEISQELCLVCDQSGHLQPTCPKSNSRFRPQRHIQAIEMEHSQHQDPGKQSRPTPSRDLDSAVKPIPPVTLRKDVMNMEDGNGLDSCDRDDSARGMGVRGTEVVLAPRGETGSFTQMPPTSLLYSHQPAKLNLSNSFNLDPTFSDPSILVSALSSLRKTLLHGTLDSGPFRTLILSSWIAAPMTLFMDSKLAADLQIPLLELSTPITLRLADGDSSSSLTHRTVPLLIAYWKACGDGHFLRN